MNYKCYKKNNNAPRLNTHKKSRNRRFNEPYSSVNTFFLDTLVWLNTSFTKCEDVKLHQAVRIVNKLFSILRTRGKPEAIRYTKEIRLAFLTFIMLKHDERRDFKLPKLLNKIKQMILKDEKDYPLIRLTLTSLYITRFLRLSPTPSYESISKEPEFSEIPIDLGEYVEPFLRTIGVNTRHIGKTPRKIVRIKPHMTSKSGPNGHALWESLYEAKLVIKNTELFQSLSNMASGITQWIIASCDLYSSDEKFFNRKSLSKDKKNLLRKISLIQDKEGKTREVAIMDYWSQMVLKPLHDYMFKWLSRIKQDCTFEQHKFLCKIKRTKGSSFHSIDLTTATDRFPIIIQELILSKWFGQKYAKNWTSVMVGFPFKLPNHTGSIKYGTGNPMGAYSSWAVFAISHHFLVFVACKQANHNWKRCPYMLLGDDIVIADDEVAHNYKELLRMWKIPYSENKTHISKRGYEFAKQIIIDDTNVSPFPISALHERRHQYFLGIGIIFNECYEKSWGHEGFLGIAQKYMKLLKYSPSFIKSRESMLDMYVSFILYYKGDHIELGRAIKRYVAKKSKAYKKALKPGQWVILTQSLVLQILDRTFSEGFKNIDTEVTISANRKLLTSMMLKQMSVQNSLGVGDNPSQLIPAMSLWKISLDAYIRLKRRPEDFTSQLATLPKQMKGLFENIHLNICDKSVFVRRQDFILLASLKSAGILFEVLNNTESVVQYGRKLFDVPWFQKL